MASLAPVTAVLNMVSVFELRTIVSKCDIEVRLEMCISDLCLDRIKAFNDRGRAVLIAEECEHEIGFPQQQSEQDFLASAFLAYDSVHLSDVRIWIRFDVCKEGNIVTPFPAMMGINACIHIVPVLGTL